ncbi:MAG: hypothetical protein GYA36_23195 [Veillonellaceae bacterium]|nr:hypothetical protein [Veillonellaceae bacterium]
MYGISVFFVVIGVLITLLLNQLAGVAAILVGIWFAMTARYEVDKKRWQQFMALLEQLRREPTKEDFARWEQWEHEFTSGALNEMRVSLERELGVERPGNEKAKDGDAT